MHRPAMQVLAALLALSFHPQSTLSHAGRIFPNSEERIVIPYPPEPPFSDQSDCPHDLNVFSDIEPWSSATTWPDGIVPFSGNVTLPENKKIIVQDSSLVFLDFVTIPETSELIFDDIFGGILFQARGIDVQGKLSAGSPSCFLEHSLTITLYGARPSDAVTKIRDPIFKGIAVSGELSLHGRRFFRTWSKLAVTAKPGDTSIKLQDAVNWEPGQEIVLVTTALKDSREWHRNEVAIVKEVVFGARNGQTIILQSPLSYQHLAIEEYQGEVALLSRNIKIQGDNFSEPNDLDPLNCQQSQGVYGDYSVPCPNTHLTGFGGHIIVHNQGKAFVEGVELFRMGQTNVMGRYPMHFHMIGDCPDCYFRHSSVHRSFYRCVSIHGTNYAQVSENTAYDVEGYCYYLEDGTEHHNRIEYNLGAHIHMILSGPPPSSQNGQTIDPVVENEDLANPADITASAFYISNVQNYLVGNVASGGWSGFSFPTLMSPIGLSTAVKLRPASVTGLQIDGNTAHSTAWWWKNAGAFYWGGSLYYNDDGLLEYTPGRDLSRRRSTCLINKCLPGFGNNCDSWCRPFEQGTLNITNTKVYLTAGIGHFSWDGRMNMINYECHDCGLAINSLSKGFWVNNMLATCRTQTPIVLPSTASLSEVRGTGFQFYDTGTEHIITDATFRNCGYRSQEYDHYDKSKDRGCGGETDKSCSEDSTVWSFLTHSDQHVPEIMQGTRAITHEKCGRLFRFNNFRRNQISTVSGRLQNWYDMDGSVTGFREPSVIASGQSEAGMWWQIEDDVVYDEQGPLWFINLKNGPQRGLAHFQMAWDDSLHSQIGTTQCGNGPDIPCDTVGYMQHVGDYFEGDDGLPITANPDVVGFAGGFGWRLRLDAGAPKSIRFDFLEVDPDTPLLLSIAYPPGTSFTITALTDASCEESDHISCSEVFHRVDSVDQVRSSPGNAYYVDLDGVLTFRIVQTPKTYVGNPDFFLPRYSDENDREDGYALDHFEQNGVLLPRMTTHSHLTLVADCPVADGGVYCSTAAEDLPLYNPQVCPDGYHQTGYDVCTDRSNPRRKKYADGSSQLSNEEILRLVASSASMHSASGAFVGAFMLVPLVWLFGTFT